MTLKPSPCRRICRRQVKQRLERDAELQIALNTWTGTQLAVIVARCDLVRKRLGQANHRRAAQILDDHCLADAGRKCDPPGRHALRMQAQHVLGLPHRAPSSAVATACG